MKRWDEGETDREVRRNVLEWVLLVLLALVAVAYLVQRTGAEDPAPEVTLAPIVVQMADPFPCSTNLRNRIAYQRLGAVCSGGDR